MKYIPEAGTSVGVGVKLDTWLYPLGVGLQNSHHDILTSEGVLI